MSNQEVQRRVQELERRIIDAKSLVFDSRLRLKDYLKGIQKIIDRPDIDDAKDPDKDLFLISVLEVYKMFLLKEKALYSTLNKFKTEGGLYIGFCWIPTLDNQEVMRHVEGLKDKNRNIEIP